MKCYGYECNFYVVDEIHDIEFCANEDNCYRLCNNKRFNIERGEDYFVFGEQFR